MQISELSIRRPVATALCVSAMVAFGWLAYKKLATSDLPNVDFPTLQVTATEPGASPETMASAVATPLEREFSTIAGLDSMTSSSLLGSTSITLQFTLDRNIDAASQDVQAAISRAGARLPHDMPAPPSYKKVNPADQPILYLAITSPSLPLYQIDEFAQTSIGQRISTVSGVAQVQVFGSQKYAVRAQLDPQKLAAHDLGIDEVARSIASLNVNLPTGVMNGRDQMLTLSADGQLFDANAYRHSIVAWRGGNPVRLEELGRVVDGVENDRVAAWFNDARGVILAIQRQPGSNTVAAVDAVRALLPSIQSGLPASIKIDTLYDRSESIRASVHDVQFTLMLTLCLVVAVIFLFLRNVRATAIPSLAMPLSVVGTFAVMYLCNFSLDNMSLMALTLSVGFVVDDAIVVLENIVRHMEMKKPPLQAAIEGSREIGFTILSMTISLVAVFLPVLFMGGVVGRLLNEFAITIAVSILISGAVSLTLTPMLCSRFLKAPSEERHGAFFRATERGFESVLGLYRRSLLFVLRHKIAVLVLSAATLWGTVALFQAVPKGFLPNEDVARIFIQTEGPEGISFEGMVRLQQSLAQVLRDDPNVLSFMSSIGQRGGAAIGVNTGSLFARLKDRKDRELSVDQLIEVLRPKLAAVAGVRAFAQNPPTIRIGGVLTKSQYQVMLQGLDTDELYGAAPRFAESLRKIKGFRDVTTDLQLENPQLSVSIDRDKAASLGVSPEQIEIALASCFGTRQISTIFASTNSYEVILELDPAYQGDPKWLSIVHVRSNTGALVPLTSVANLSRDVGPLTVNHSGQLPAVSVSFNLDPGYSLSSAVTEVERVQRELPGSISASFQGTAQVFQQSLVGLGTLLIVSVLVIYAILGILYESFIHPLTILTALPFAGFGAIATLMLFHVEMSVYAFVGVILLIGLVKKNGIMMIDFALEGQRERGLEPERAIVEACLVRFRPIMMTTMAALMGTLPIALGYGSGAESRRPLGLAVVGGLFFSQTITLFVTPVFYVWMEDLRRFFTKKKPSGVSFVDGNGHSVSRLEEAAAAR